MVQKMGGGLVLGGAQMVQGGGGQLVQGLGQELGQELRLEPMEDRRVQLGREL